MSFDFIEGEKENTWLVSARSKSSEIEMVIKCPVNEMLWIRYESPDGMMRHKKLWNGGTGYGFIKLYHVAGAEKSLVENLDVYNVGCEFGTWNEPV